MHSAGSTGRLTLHFDERDVMIIGLFINKYYHSGLNPNIVQDFLFSIVFLDSNKAQNYSSIRKLAKIFQKLLNFN